MAPADRFSAPGDAYYHSDTMTVGDGTWDFDKNTFLLPNLVGLNFETMRYNGTGDASFASDSPSIYHLFARRTEYFVSYGIPSCRYYICTSFHDNIPEVNPRADEMSACSL